MAARRAADDSALTETLPCGQTRRHPRYVPRAKPIADVLVRPSLRPFHAAVHNVSLRGIGLLHDQPLPLGAVLAVRLNCWSRGAPSATLLGHVVHVTRQRDACWLIGCEFRTPLNPEELPEIVWAPD